MNYMIKLFIMIALTVIIIIAGLYIFQYFQNPKYDFDGYEFGDDHRGYNCLILAESDTIDKCPRPGKPGRFFKHYYKDSVWVSFCSGGGAVVGPLVTDAVADSHYVLVSQKTVDSIYEFKLENYLFEKDIFSDKQPTYAECARALRKSKFFEYWIIKKSEYELYGPLSKSEYKQMKKKLKVPVKLKLDFEK